MSQRPEIGAVSSGFDNGCVSLLRSSAGWIDKPVSLVSMRWFGNLGTRFPLPPSAGEYHDKAMMEAPDMHAILAPDRMNARPTIARRVVPPGTEGRGCHRPRLLDALAHQTTHLQFSAFRRPSIAHAEERGPRSSPAPRFLELATH